jgi:flagellar basal body-associated protein FliL
MSRYIDTDGKVKDAPIIDRTVERNATEARQGSTGRPVLVVLIAALVLALVAWGIAEIYGFSIAPEQPDPPATSANSNAEPPAQNTIDSSPAPGDAQPQRGVSP